MNQIKHLERAALDAHRHGIGWTDFWQRHGVAVREAEPFNRQRYHRLVRHLLHLLASGEASGEHPVAVGLLWGEEWDDDDAAGLTPQGDVLSVGGTDPQTVRRPRHISPGLAIGGLEKTRKLNP